MIRHADPLEALAADLADALESLAAASDALNGPNLGARYTPGWELAHRHAEHCEAAVLIARQRLTAYRRRGTTAHVDRLSRGRGA